MIEYAFDDSGLLAACFALSVMLGLVAGLLMGLGVVLLDRRKRHQWKAHRASALRP